MLVAAAFTSAGANIGTDQSNTFITILNAAITDVARTPNQVAAITDGAALQIGPQLFKFALDMDACSLTFRFSEPVNPNTFDPTLVTVQNAQTASTAYTLTGQNGILVKHSNYTVVMFLTSTDCDAVKATSGLLYDISNSYVRMATGAIKDYVSGSWIGPNNLLALADGNALQAELMNVDATSPNLLTFSLDMNVGQVRSGEERSEATS